MACANLVYPNGFTRPFGGDWGGFLGGFSSLLIAAQPFASGAQVSSWGWLSHFQLRAVRGGNR